MLLKLLGWFWIALGIVSLFKPKTMRNRLQKKSAKKLKRILFGISLLLGVLLTRATWGLEGFLPNVLLLCGLILIIKAFFFLKAKSSDIVIEWLKQQSVQFYRIVAIIYIVFGGILLSV